MREVGVIKWFGGYNANKGRDNDYGFVASEGRADLYVHRSECRCPEEFLIEGTPISFEVGMNRVTGKEQAINVLVLTEETDWDTIVKAMNMGEQKFWQSVAGKFFHRAEAADAVPVAVKKLEALKGPMKGDFFFRLPEEIKENKKVKALMEEPAEAK